MTGITKFQGLYPGTSIGLPPAPHSHAEADVTSLVADLAGKAATSHTHAAGDVTSGTLSTARLGTGTPAAGKYVDGAAGAWTSLPVAGTGDVVGPASAVNNSLAAFNGTTGKIILDAGLAISAVATLTGTQTLTNKTLTSPAITTPTGIVKGDVGLGNVANVDQQNAVNLTSGTVGTARLGTGTADSSTFLSGDGTWKTTTGTPGGVAVAKASTTANITLSGTQTIDGVSCVAGDRVLVKDQSSPQNNGIYNVAAGAWTRTIDADTAIELAGCGVVQIQQGTLNGSTRWVTTFKSTDTLGTTVCNWYPNDAAPNAMGLYSTATDQTITTATFTTVAIGGTADHDYLGMTVASNIVTVNSAGTYDIRASVLWDTSASNTLRQFLIETWTGADPGVGLGTALVYDIRPTGTNGNVGQSISVTYTFAAGAKTRAIVYQATGAGLKLMHSLSRSRFAIRKIA